MTVHLTLINYFFAYAEALENAFKRFSRHINENNWDRTVFQFYLNDKISYRENGNISGAPWLFDEPVNTRDFMALQWYGRLWRKAVNPVDRPAQL